MVAEVQSALNQKGGDFTGVGSIKDIPFVDFFREDRLLVSKVIAVVRSVGCASLELTCELIDPGGGDGSSSMMVPWLVAWASWLVLVVAVGVSAVWVVIFLGGMMGNEGVSRRQVEVSV